LRRACCCGVILIVTVGMGLLVLPDWQTVNTST
jgi:hypothetical protein